MAKLTFVGGIHPYDGKDLSKDKPIQDVQPKGEMVYPLSQHIGAPAKPIVAKGDRVLAGQKIAESGGFVSAPIYASVSGTVKTIETRRVVTGDLIHAARPSGVIPPLAFLQVPSAFLYSETCLKPHRTAYLLPHILKNAA